MKKAFTFFYILMIPALAMGQWVSQATGFQSVSRGIQYIWAVDENVVWATAYDGSGADSVIQEFTRTVNGGLQWTPGTVNGAGGLEPSMVFALNADTAWIAYHHPTQSGGKIMCTYDGGMNWTHQATALFPDSAEGYPNTLYFWNKNEGFCMGDPTYGYFEIYTTSNGGNNWIRVDSNDMPAMISGEWGYAGFFSVVGNSVWFGTSKGRLIRSNDKGHHWTAINTPLLNTGRARVVQFRDTLNGIIADRSNNAYVLYATDDGGQTWQALSPSGTVYGTDLIYIKGTPQTYISTGAATGASGAGISYDGGLSWSDISMAAGTQYTALGFPGPVTGWAGQFNQSSTSGGIARFTGGTVAIPHCPENESLIVFPNPSDGIFQLLANGSKEINFIRITGMAGQLVLHDIARNANGVIDMRHMEDGIYLLEAHTDNQIFRMKIILKKR